MKQQHLLPLLLIGCSLPLFTARAGTTADADASKMTTTPPVPESWKTKTISPVADIIFFEDPIVRTEITPVFMYHDVDKDFFTGGGHTEIYGARLQYAITPQWGVFINKGGYMDIHSRFATEKTGFADTGFGTKYMLIDDEANQFVLTPGLTYSLAAGSSQVGFGNGNGEWNLFTSAEKGFGNLHLTARVGVRLPNDTKANSSIAHYGLQADYYCCRYFIPFISGVGYTVINAGDRLPIDSEGVDAQNFGASLSQGVTQVIVGAGFRSKITDNIDIGVAYQKGVAKPYGIFEDRVTVAVQFTF